MEDTENYTSLHEFTEDISARGNKPILYTSQSRQAGIKGMECMKKRMVVILFITLLVSLCANIALGVSLVNSISSRAPSQASAGGPEVSSLSLKLSSLQERHSRMCADYNTLGQACSRPGMKVSVKRCRPCPESWRQIENKCYYFGDKKLNWSMSRDSCTSMGSHLTILHTHEQHDALDKIARSIGGFDYHFWIGLSDTEEEGVWKWVDNTLVNKPYWNDAGSEPNNHQSGGLHGEDCAVLDSRAKSWFDVPCDHIYKPICEMDAINID